MASSEKHEIVVATIMEKARLAIARRRSPDAFPEEELSTGTVPSHLLNDEIAFGQDPEKTLVWRIIKRVQYKLQKYAFYDFLYYKIAVKFRSLIPKYRNRCTVQDLSKFHDEEFIQNAYWMILKREPDTQGQDYYLAKLHNGDLSKAEILGSLRYSAEGRQHNVKISGALSSYLLHAAHKVPILGSLSKYISALTALSSLIKRLNALEAHSPIREKQIEGIINMLSDKVETRTLAESKAVIAKELRGKANVQELTEVLSELREKLGATIYIEGKLREEKDALDALYVAFEDRFRGTRQDIKDRVSIYLPTIEQARATTGSTDVLDLGCGRGEWLEVLKEHGYLAKGVDLNTIMVQQCRERSLDVIDQDVIVYLRQQQSESISAITGFHLVEHLSYRTLLTLFDECLRVLKPGGLVIFETPNPENLIVGAFSFYFDPSHKNPLPPGTLQFLVEHCGFMSVSVRKLHKYSDFVSVNDADEFKDKWFYSDMDYAVTAFKNADV